jgi:hypothetical protein
MEFPALVKSRSGFRVEPDLRDYEATRASFSWEAAALEGLPGGRGLSPRAILAESFAKADGCSRGRGGSIPEADYQKPATLDSCVDSLAARMRPQPQDAAQFPEKGACR